MKDIFKKFDQYLQKKNLKFSGTIIGGAALITLGVVDRKTKDVDCLDPDLPADIKSASIDFAKKNNKSLSVPLMENWLNNGPKSLKRDLPADWQKEIKPLFSGKNLKLTTLSRRHLLLSKLFAYCDRQEDLNDCLALKPTLSELQYSYPWVAQRDTNEMWPKHVKNSFAFLAKELGYEFNA